MKQVLNFENKSVNQLMYILFSINNILNRPRQSFFQLKKNISLIRWNVICTFLFKFLTIRNEMNKIKNWWNIYILKNKFYTMYKNKETNLYMYVHINSIT